MVWVIAMLHRFLVACLLLTCWIGMARADERRIALVIGVSNYEHAPRLGNTLNWRCHAHLDLDSVLEQMEGVSRFSLVFLDACRDNPFRTKIAAGTREAPTRGLARVSPGSGTFIAFSTAPGTVAQDGTGANSPFAAALLKRIETAGLES
jgi:uncharacterized caspase-like protein